MILCFRAIVLNFLILRRNRKTHEAQSLKRTKFSLIALSILVMLPWVLGFVMPADGLLSTILFRMPMLFLS